MPLAILGPKRHSFEIGLSQLALTVNRSFVGILVGEHLNLSITFAQHFEPSSILGWSIAIVAALLASQMLPYSFGAFTLTFQAHPCSLHWAAGFQFDLAFAIVSDSLGSLVLRLVAALGLS